MLKDTLKSWFTKGNAAEAGKTSDQLEGVSRVARGIAHTVCSLRQLYEVTSRPLQDIGHINYIIEAKRDRVDNFALPVLENLKSFIDEEKTDIKSLTVMGFCYSIVESGTLYKELGELKKLGSSLCKELEKLEELKKLGGSLHEEFKKFKKDEHKNYQRFCCKLEKIVEDFKLEDLENKIRLLVLLREEMDFANIQKAYDNWYFNDLIGNINFRQEYVNKAVEERERPVRENFKENIDKCIRLAEQGKQIASRHFEESIVFQAYCKETKEANKALNINLIHYDKSKPIKISDILQQEKDIGKLNIYCNKKHDIFARREDKKRYYEFKEGAYYQMTSKWPIKDESGRVVLTCTMVMDVSSEGITEITEFSGEVPNGGNCTLSPEEHMELIERNEELHIQGSPLHKAVKKFLEVQRNREEVIRKGEDGKRDSSLPDVVPGGNIGASKVHEEQPDLGESNENMGRNTGNQPRYITKISLVPGTDTPPIYKTTVYVKLSENPEFIECTEGLEGVIEGDIDSIHDSDNPRVSNPTVNYCGTDRAPVQ
ncbi:MAG: hypothetical protein PG978_001396 [Wolbachia endosymbiont of Ctenocephalides felis wCfeF]|nr:MAG: hypothetical protein PG978_001396 [Wolbachia endosymbiont of Ctenocephalides felis wCfeF]